jgi:hypothetical protein
MAAIPANAFAAIGSSIALNYGPITTSLSADPTRRDLSLPVVSPKTTTSTCCCWRLAAKTMYRM